MSARLTVRAAQQETCRQPLSCVVTRPGRVVLSTGPHPCGRCCCWGPPPRAAVPQRRRGREQDRRRGVWHTSRAERGQKGARGAKARWYRPQERTPPLDLVGRSCEPLAAVEAHTRTLTRHPGMAHAQSGDTALHAASRAGAVGVVAALLAAGARPCAASAKVRLGRSAATHVAFPSVFHRVFKHSLHCN